MSTLLREARKKKGLTQAELAAALGRDQSSISKYEAGEIRPDVDVAKRYAELLDISVVDVLYPPSAEAA
ncbi:helix-turn-helix transcriptional regulator [Arenimonas oryziterrae]|uniref:Repressor protein n=1 Tax=Arenimonas oryziterrae DSM 21050 = YC6267 TaxID=1121015 RepID=A0A091ATG6_9GAMM|nr:helix-turn-helix transcriptional regulator [Arenimonas oryziterrae]KFN42309.1 repressor protein [Arenimonas oryziterrae DSM 21050 = YC6267]